MATYLFNDIPFIHNHFDAVEKIGRTVFRPRRSVDNNPTRENSKRASGGVEGSCVVAQELLLRLQQGVVAGALSVP